MAQKLNKLTGELITIRIPGMWSHMPVPSYKVLARKKEWQAQRLLICLISYMGGNNGLEVFPSYDEIRSRCGMHPGQIKKNLILLEEYGFIKIHQFFNGSHKQNKYYLQLSNWDTSRMNSLAKQGLIESFKCLDCGKGMDRGGFGNGLRGVRIHYGCGGQVVARDAIERASLLAGLDSIKDDLNSEMVMPEFGMSV